MVLQACSELVTEGMTRFNGAITKKIPFPAEPEEVLHSQSHSPPDPDLPYQPVVNARPSLDRR
jgi:hypothetical protein